MYGLRRIFCETISVGISPGQVLQMPVVRFYRAVRPAVRNKSPEATIDVAVAVDCRPFTFPITIPEEAQPSGEASSSLRLLPISTPRARAQPHTDA